MNLSHRISALKTLKTIDPKGSYVDYINAIKREYGDINPSEVLGGSMADAIPPGAPVNQQDPLLNDDVYKWMQETGDLIKSQYDSKSPNISTEGYRDNSPDRNNDYNIIPGGNISMQGVSQPIEATPMFKDGSSGYPTIMQPGNEYHFPGAEFTGERKVFKNGGTMDSNTANDYETEPPHQAEPLDTSPIPTDKPKGVVTNLYILRHGFTPLNVTQLTCH